MADRVVGWLVCGAFSPACWSSACQGCWRRSSSIGAGASGTNFGTGSCPSPHSWTSRRRSNVGCAGSSSVPWWSSSWLSWRSEGRQGAPVDGEGNRRTGYLSTGANDAWLDLRRRRVGGVEGDLEPSDVWAAEGSTPVTLPTGRPVAERSGAGRGRSGADCSASGLAGYLRPPVKSTKAGPMTTMNSTGRMQKTRGKMTLTGSFMALSSARKRRFSRCSAAWVRRTREMGTP